MNRLVTMLHETEPLKSKAEVAGEVWSGITAAVVSRAAMQFRRHTSQLPGEAERQSGAPIEVDDDEEEGNHMALGNNVGQPIQVDEPDRVFPSPKAPCLPNGTDGVGEGCEPSADSAGFPSDYNKGTTAAQGVDYRGVPSPRLKWAASDMEADLEAEAAAGLSAPLADLTEDHMETAPTQGGGNDALNNYPGTWNDTVPTDDPVETHDGEAAMTHEPPGPQRWNDDDNQGSFVHNPYSLEQPLGTEASPPRILVWAEDGARVWTR